MYELTPGDPCPACGRPCFECGDCWLRGDDRTGEPPEDMFTCAKCGKSFKESHIHDCFECEQTFCDECFPVHRPFYTVSYFCSEFVEGFTVRVQAHNEQSARETAQFLIDEEHPSAHHVITAIDKEEPCAS